MPERIIYNLGGLVTWWQIIKSIPLNSYHKLQIVLKELKESLYWLRLIRKAQLLPDIQTDDLLNEATELVKIIAKSVVTAKRGK